jgi:NAD(P)-dependent dehydrogenase (short-subunit alcohol dehydrogenase family)
MADQDRPAPELSAEAQGLAPGRDRLRGKRVVVVGAGSIAVGDPEAPIGNGQAISVLAAREGASVACVDINPTAAARTVELIEAEQGIAVSIVADVTDAEQCQRLVADAVDALGGIDVLVLNVGIGMGVTVARTTVEEWDRTFAVNLRAHFLVTQAALAAADGLASVVFVSSVAGLKPGSRIPAYDASKAGIFGLSRQVAREGASRGIRANVVVPGLIDTPLGRAASAGRSSRAGTPVPLRRQGTGWEVAYAALFLMSDESSYVTAQTLVVDGGLTGAQ